MLACIACVKEEGGGGRDDAARSAGGGDTPTCRDPVKSLTSQLKDMVLKLSGTQRQGHRRGGSPPPRGRTTSLYRSGYYRPGVVQDDMAVPPTTYLGGGTGTSSSSSTLARPEGEAREWVAQVEPGVQITFVSLPAGNDLKRIRFSREMYDKWQAQKWWGDNNERIMELYNVRRQVLPTPPRSEVSHSLLALSLLHMLLATHGHGLGPKLLDAVMATTYDAPPCFGRMHAHESETARQEDSPTILRESSYSQVGSTRGSPAATPDSSSITWGSAAARQHSLPPPPPSERACPQRHNSAGNDAARTTTSSRDEVSISNASELEVTEWVIQDEPGVYITVRELADGTRELRRVRFSRERFAELNAKLWWEENKERIQAQYL